MRVPAWLCHLAASFLQSTSQISNYIIQNPMVCLGQNKCPFPCMGVIAILGQSLFSKKYQSGSRNA